MDLIWWIIVIAIVLIIGVVSIVRWIYRKGKKGYNKFRRR